jgi:hypothetical protein
LRQLRLLTVQQLSDAQQRSATVRRRLEGDEVQVRQHLRHDRCVLGPQ